ncbi:MAG: hypothetical protein AABY13_00920 [Nanoarchaeota archaeon]
MEKQPIEEFILRLEVDVPVTPLMVATMFDVRDQLYEGNWAAIKEDLDARAAKPGILPKLLTTCTRDSKIITQLMQLEQASGPLSLQRDYAQQRAYVIIPDQKTA